MSQKTVLISGGSRGLGASLVKHYLEQGFKVATFSRTKSEFIAAMENSEEYSDHFLWCEASLADINSLKNCFNLIIKKFGSVNILINNAAIAKEGILMSMKDNDIQEIIQTNLIGTIQITKLCLKSMSVSGSGNIVFISSIVGLIGASGISIYSSTKAAMDGLVRALTREFSGRNIRINSVAPGYLDTEMTEKISEKSRKRIIYRTPLGRLGTAGDVVKVVNFLTSEDSQFIAGQTIVVDGGFTS